MEGNRIRIDEIEQRKIFRELIYKFDNNFLKTSAYLNIAPSTLSAYKRYITKYIPEELFFKIINYLGIEKPKILEIKTLTEIRQNYIKKAHIVLEEKYGKKWNKELTKRRDARGITLSNFPDNTFIYLEEKYRKKFLDCAVNLCGKQYLLMKKINKSNGRFINWYRGNQKDYITKKEGLQFIPLCTIRYIANLLEEDNRDEFSIENIEKNIVLYRMQAGNVIKEPNFQIKESPELIRLLFHLLGDGYGGCKGECANYKNTQEELLNEFEQDLSIFGKIQIYKQKDSIKFPSIIAKVISNYFSINFKTYESEISNKILYLPKKLLKYGIRAFVDDEGSIYQSYIRISSANKNLLNGISIILKYLKLRHSSIKPQINKKARYGYTFYIDIYEIEKKQRLTGSTHFKKSKKLEMYAKKRKSRHRKKELKS